MIKESERYREILGALARHGIGVVSDELIKHESGEQARAEHLRRACEELGPMFIKLGQALSTRDDLLPDAYREELANLQDEVMPVPGKLIADVIREDLGAPPDQLFAFFDLEPSLQNGRCAWRPGWRCRPTGSAADDLNLQDEAAGT